MKNFIRSLAAAALLSGLVAGTAVAGQIQPDTFGVITLTEQNKNDKLPDFRGKDVLLIVGSSDFAQAHLTELHNLAVLHKDKLVVIIADPEKVEGMQQLVASLITPARYPAALYIGPVLHNVVGPMPDGVITAMCARGLQRKAGIDTPQ